MEPSAARNLVFVEDGLLTYERTDGGPLRYRCGLDFDDDRGTPSRWGQGRKAGTRSSGL